MLRGRQWAVACCLFAWCGQAAMAAESDSALPAKQKDVTEDVAADWLTRMSESARQANYQGVVVYRSGEVLESLHVVHGFDGDTVRERLVSMSGEPREILREDDEVTCILPREKKITVDFRSKATGLFPSLPRETINQLRAYYEFNVIGRMRIADHQCRGVRIQPKDAYRYGYEFWVDETTGVPLKLSLLDEDGRVLEQLMFTEVTFPKTIAAEDFQTTQDLSGFQKVTQRVSAKPPSAVAAWIVDQVPPGFRLMTRDLRQMRGDNDVVEHLLFSDGLSAVSIYAAVTSSADGKAFEGVSHMGAVNAFGRMLGTHHLTVVGEVPQATVEMIGGAVRAAPPDTQTASP